MLQDFLTDFNNAKLQSSLIPKGTIVKVKMAIKPGGYENWFTKSYDTGNIYLNAEFTVIEGPYAKCKIYQIIGIKSGKSEGKEDTWGESGRSMIRSILESARNIHTNDTSEKAVLARKINSIADLNGLEFTAKVGIEANNTYGDRNRIATVITPEQEKNSDADWIPF
ncbi:hypothetical protein [Wolbachia endosymbiont (group B) of Parapoynx stratiotata]|uniref:hypothetical protein n=1 Tax=Wolbachia endosymbiont (group B) of Parapoynx stratiotata TaxID=2954040 RepID=UPI0022276F54|nr:hypothetical protein [Wolbachia endosymbiont (group B) of Parapoynx stratiotata]